MLRVYYSLTNDIKYKLKNSNLLGVIKLINCEEKKSERKCIKIHLVSICMLLKKICGK
jgi:hypothetical protein